MNLAQDDSAQLTELPSFKAYQAGIADRCVTPPQVIQLGLELIEFNGLKAAPVPA